MTKDLIASPAKLARVLPAASATQQDAPIDPEPVPTKTIPAAHVARIRTWLRYGMTITQIAAVYGVDTCEIAKLLGKA